MEYVIVFLLTTNDLHKSGFFRVLSYGTDDHARVNGVVHVIVGKCFFGQQLADLGEAE